jgi:threonine dehydratase
MRHARDAVHAYLSPTPLVESDMDGHGCHLKLETFQPSGSFKVRGAIAAASRLPAGSRIVTASAGNHALGIAWAAERLAIPATVVIAETASRAKRGVLELLPIELVIHGSTYDEAEAFALQLAADPARQATFVSPYNDPDVVAGQATIIDEILDQAPGTGPLTVIVPGGGGGLLAGCAIRARERAIPERPIRIVGVESARSLGLSASVRAGETVMVEIGMTIADGLSGNLEPGSITVALLRDASIEMVAVSDEQIAEGIRLLVRRHGIVAEGAGAAAVAALHAGLIPDRDGEGTTVAVVSGRNIALTSLAAILTGPS